MAIRSSGVSSFDTLFRVCAVWSSTLLETIGTTLEDRNMFFGSSRATKSPSASTGAAV